MVLVFRVFLITIIYNKTNFWVIILKKKYILNEFSQIQFLF